MNKKDDKTTEIIASTGMTIGVANLVSLVTGIINTPYNFLFLTGAILVGSPATYFGLKKIKNKFDERIERDMHYAGQMALMFEDVLKPDYKITKTTSLFLNQILDRLDKEHIKLEKSSYMNINQFLYLINSNYYDDISKEQQSITRECLVNDILNQIVIYLKRTSNSTFGDNDADMVLVSCFFLKNEIKRKIAEEFRHSKTVVASTITYEIIRNDLVDGSIKSYMSKRSEDESERNASGFDIYSECDYHTLIQGFLDKELILELGNSNELEWDMDLLIRIIQLIGLKYRQELLEHNSKHNNLNLAASYIYNLISYALVNNRKEVGCKEMIAVFKNWNYLPFDIKLNVLDDIFEQENLSYDNHPFKVSKSKKQNTKIIEFKSKNK